MATPSQYLDDAAQYVGISGDYNIFNEWYWCELNGYGYIPPFAWCASFQSYVGVRDLGMPFSPSASAAGVAWQGERVLDSEVRQGDWVLFNWDGRQDFGWADHIGVVEWSDINGSGYFGTIEGNTGSVAEGEVARVTRYNWGSYATAFFRPPYTGEEPEPMPTPEQFPGSTVNDAGFAYRVHTENVGWFPPVRDGQTAGSVGYAAQMEAIKMRPPSGYLLEVCPHVQNKGWMRFVVDGDAPNSGEGSSEGDPIIGTTGQALQIEALIIRVLRRPEGDNRKLWFRVHQQTYGWKAWTEEGFASGSDGEAMQLEALQIKLV